MLVSPFIFVGSVGSAGSNGTRGVAGKATGIFREAPAPQLPAAATGAPHNRITFTSPRELRP
jgi:hypothetical protein